MGKKVGAKSFFFIIVSVATLFLSVFILQSRKILIGNSAAKKVASESITFNLLEGFNFISIPYETGKTSTDLCNEIDGAKLIVFWNNVAGNLTVDTCKEPFPSNLMMPIKPNEGFFVVVEKPSVWRVSGSSVNPNIELKDGWNAAGVQKQSIKMASDLCSAKQFVQKGYHVTKVQTRSSGTQPNISPWTLENVWSVYRCGVKANDFQIEKGVGYYVLVEPE